MVDKKRKRESHSATHTATEVEIKAPTATPFTPIIATTPGIQLPEKLALNVYTRTRPGKKAKTALPEEYLVHGATEKIDYEGRELLEDVEMERYYVGVYDPATGEVEFHPAPRVHIRREIKEFKERDAELVTRNSAGSTFASSRAILGTAFGTKKSKKAIERRELNQVDVEEHDAQLTTSLVDQIGENTELMPTKEDLEKEHDDQRPLPPYKTDGLTSAAEVYDINDLVSAEELEQLWVEDWYKQAKTGKAVIVPNNSHVSNRIAKLGLLKTRNQANTRKLRLLKYISILRNFYVFLTNRKESDRLLQHGKEKEIAEKLQITRDLCISLLKKYTEIIGGPTKPNDDKDNFRPQRKATSPYLTKLLNYMAILCLMAEENYQVDVYYLKDDLGVTTQNLLQIFTNVGCKKKDLSAIQAESLGIPKAEVKSHRVAYLTATPEFPKARTRKRVTGRK